MDTSAVVSIAATVVAVSTAIFGYFKLIRSNKIQFVEEQVELHLIKITTLREENTRLKSNLESIARHLELCEIARRNQNERIIELLTENRDIRRELKELKG